MIKISRLFYFGVISLLAFSLGSCKTEQKPSVQIKEIQNLKELATVKYVTEVIVPTSKARRFVSDSKLLYIARGEVQAGIDLSELQEKDIKRNPEQEVVEITLPVAKILNKKIDVNASYVYNYENGFLNFDSETSHQLQAQAQRDGLARMVEAACKSDIITTANNNAKVAVKEFITSLTNNQNVKVITQSSKCCG